MQITRTRTAVLPLLGLTIAGALAGCAAPAATTTEPAETTETDTTTTETTAPDTATDAGDDASTSPYADGTYTAEGSYVSPASPETISVTVTLADGIVTGVEVVGHATDPQARSFQSQFIGGVSAAVVGQSIEGLAVDRVAGSSLTGIGFNQALDAIRADATA